MKLAETRGNSSWLVIKGSAHGTCLWRPEKVTKAVLDFLGTVDAGRDVAGEMEL